MMRNWAVDFRRTREFIWVFLGLCLGMAASFMGWGERPEVLFRKALQRLGMTYLKLGQFLALRIDLLPREWCSELGKLFEQVTPMTAGDVRVVIESETGARVEDLFARFEWEPIAAASVAQVHQAYTPGGEKVAVKVQRRDMELYFGADIRNLNRLAAIVDTTALIGSIRLKDVASEFANFTKRELDFLAEGKAAERMRKEAVYGESVPRIFWPLTTRRMLTMEFIEGISLARVKALLDAGRTDMISALAPGADLHLAMRNLARASLHQLLITGFFHADLHPGNVLLCPGNRVAFLDCGIFGAISADHRERLANHIEQISIGNIDESFRHYAGMFTPTGYTDYQAFERGAKAVLRRWFEASRSTGRPVEQRLVARFSDEMFSVVRANHLTMSMDYLLFWRALIILDATLLQLSPGFDLLGELRTFFLRHRPGLMARLQEMAETDSIPAAVHLAGNLPGYVSELLRDLVLHHLGSRLTAEESAQLRRAGDRESQTLALELIGVSFALLVRTVPHGYPRAAFLVLAIGTIVAPLFRFGERQRISLQRRNARR